MGGSTPAPVKETCGLSAITNMISNGETCCLVNRVALSRAEDHMVIP